MTYIFTVFTVAFAIAMGLMIFIIPTFAEVLTDMSEGTVPLPSSTLKLMELSDWFLGRKGLNALLVLSPLIIIGIWSTLDSFRKRKAEKPSFAFRVKDFFKWYFPVTNWFERNYALAQISSLVRNSLSAGLPVDRAIESTLTLDMNYFFKKRLSKWHHSIQRGQNISDSARELRISDSIAWAFDDRVNKGNTPQILQMLEEFYRSIYTYRVNIAKSIAMPFSIIILGLLVGFVMYAMFMPMITLLMFLADTALP
jgi:type IV pilus assembly protein PilC